MKKKSDVSVFEKYAHEYDLITNADQRVKYHAKEVNAIIKMFKPESVLDAGCATGLTSMLFAKEGIKTVGLDRSRKMLAVAKGKYQDSGYPLTFSYGEFEKLSKKFHNKFDLVVCLANSISGVHTEAELWKTFSNFNSVLKPGGHLVLQMLNYVTLEEGKLFPIKATNNNGLVYVRYSERHRKKFFVYVVRIDTNQTPPAFEVFRHDFDNFSVSEVTRVLKSCKFSKAQKYSDLLLTKKYTKTSRDLIITVQK